MRLLHLSITNFGIFEGSHTFDLMPRLDEGRRRHLTVFTGHNGAGKSTLFQAMALALYGSLALGDRVSEQDYSKFILARFHKRPQRNEDLPVSTSEAGVGLSFQYVQSGQPMVVNVERRWRRRGGSAQETLDLLQNCKPPDVDPLDYQNWLNELVPPGIAPLSFFDAEQLDSLANPEQRDGPLADILSRLLGLDLVQRLNTDLEQYALRRGSQGRVERLRIEVLQHQADLDILQAQVSDLQDEAVKEAATRVELEAELAQQERRLASEGGTYAARRPLLQERRAVIEKETKAVSVQIHDLSAELLPFALVPELCQQLGRRLVHEQEVRRRQLTDTLWQQRIAEAAAALAEEDLWKELRLDTQERETIIGRLLGALGAPGSIPSANGYTMNSNGNGHMNSYENGHVNGNGSRAFNTTYLERDQIVHHISEVYQDQLQRWISEAVSEVPQRVQALSDELRALRDEQRRIEVDLQRAPDDDVLAHIHARILELTTLLADGQRRQTGLSERLGAIQFQRDEQARKLQKAAEQLAEAQAVEREMALAERSKLVLTAYRDALTRQRLSALEEALVACFNAICRKEHLLTSVRIDPDGFSVQLRGTNDQPLNLETFSAGERQLYSLALLWAMRQVSGRSLPLAIDSPMARLDEAHRQRMVQGYIPAVSDQVLLFGTGAEMDAALLAEAEPLITRVYELSYDPQTGSSKVMSHVRYGTPGLPFG